MFYLGPRVKSRAWHSFYWKSVLLKEGEPLYDKGSGAWTLYYLQKQVVTFQLKSPKIKDRLRSSQKVFSFHGLSWEELR